MDQITIPWIVFLNSIVPFIAAQFFLVFLIYITAMRKRMSAEYPYYAAFLVAMIIFLAGNALPLLPIELHDAHQLHARMWLLFAVGCPSLIIATSLHSKLNSSKRQRWIAYTAGLFFATAYVVTSNIAWSTEYGDSSLLFGAHFMDSPIRFVHAHLIQLAAISLLLILPSTLLLRRTWQQANRARTLIGGTLIFGLCMFFGVLVKQWWIYYSGSIFSALVWGWALYQDLRELKGKSALMKEELLFLVRSGKASNSHELAEMIEKIETRSSGNLNAYKMRIREVLSMLTDATIDAGGDSDALVARNLDKIHKVESSNDPQAISQMMHNEASELAEIITKIPKGKNSSLIQKAKDYIENEFQNNIGINDISAHLGVSRSSLMAAFKQSEGTTVNQYLTGFRIERARELLRSKSVTETAFEVGFNNSNYFSTVFKKATGTTPTQYQAACAACAQESAQTSSSQYKLLQNPESSP
jgi:AraC-like DNA-binding protein